MILVYKHVSSYDFWYIHPEFSKKQSCWFKKIRSSNEKQLWK